MKRLAEPYYAKDITGQLRRFDDRNTGFSRAAVEGDRYTARQEKRIKDIEKRIPGKTILNHAMYVAGRTVDYILRKNALGRDEATAYNREFRLRDPDPETMAKIIKELGRLLGANLVGIAKLNPLWIYSHWGQHNAQYTDAAKPGEPINIPAECDRVIVMIHEMDYAFIRRTLSPEVAIDLGYSEMAWCASSLATFIRELGFHAIPCGNELGLSIPMAIDAGLGELGRMGLLLTREFGPRVRISKVFTDLPLSTDSPIDIGVQDFCQKCELCAKYCPPRAIMSGPKTDKGWDQSNSEGVLKWPTHAMKCLDWWVTMGRDCSACIQVCPWNKPDTLFHKSVRVMAERGFLTPVLVFFDQLTGYGKPIEKTKSDFFQDPSVVKIMDS